MEAKSKELLHQLLMTPSPSGSEQVLQRLVRRHVEPFVDVVEPDIHGNLLIGINTRASRKLVISTHCDQIGFMVKHISEDGYVTVEAVGGVDETVLLGAQVVIHHLCGPARGVFGKKPIHLQSKSESEQVPRLDNMWIDIGAKDKKDAERRVAIGDYATFELRVTELSEQCLSAPGLDNKAGLFVGLEVIRQCAESPIDFAVYLISTVQEEIGARGAETACNHLEPELGLAIDVTLASDDPGNQKSSTIPCRLRSGPCISHGPNTNPVLEKLLLDTARKHKIPHQPSPTGELEGNDAKALQTSDSGVATAVVGIPERNMHTQVEVVDLIDLDNSVRLVSECLKSLKHDMDFRPFYFKP